MTIKQEEIDNRKPGLEIDRPVWFWILIILTLVVTLFLLALFFNINLKKTELLGVTIWSWAQLLVVPAILTFGTLTVNHILKVQDEKKKQLSESQERRRLEQEKEVAIDRNQQNILLDYFDRMSKLLLGDKWPKNINRAPALVAANLVRSWTLLSLKQLDGKRKGLLINFLIESGVIKDISLSKASLEEADLHGVDLQNIDLRWANLSGANLVSANLSGANLESAKLKGAMLWRANLSAANLKLSECQQATLQNVNFEGADLSGANLTNANLTGTSLIKTHGILFERVNEAYLCATDLPQGIELDPKRDCEKLNQIFNKQKYTQEELKKVRIIFDMVKGNDKTKQVNSIKS